MWDQILSGVLTQSPTAAILGYVCWKLWTKLEARDTEIRELNALRIKDMLDVVNRDD